MSEVVSEFIKLFENLPDSRQPGKVKHRLMDIIFIAIVGTIVGCDDFESIEEFAKVKRSWFQKYLQLPYGIPSHDTIERVFHDLDSSSFLQIFLSYARVHMPQLGQGTIAIDGKTMRGTGDDVKNPLHIVNAYFSETGMVLGQVTTDEKSNEITAIPLLLELLTVKGHIVTMDAMGTQTKIAEAIVRKGGDYVLALKGNHPILHKEVVDFFAQNPSDIEGFQHLHQISKAHGRAETRDYYITDAIRWMDARKDWAKLASIGMAVTRWEKAGVQHEEKRYFLCSIEPQPHKFAYAVRNHWGVESMHWSLDVTFNEDKRKTRKDFAGENLAQMLRFVYNILKRRPTYNGRKMTKKRQRLIAGWDETYLVELLGAMME